MKKGVLLVVVFWVAFPFAKDVLPLAAGQAQETVAVDPFYLKLFEDGKILYLQGRFQEAVDTLKVASFGLIDARDRLLECYIYLSTGYLKIRRPTPPRIGTEKSSS